MVEKYPSDPSGGPSGGPSGPDCEPVQYGSHPEVLDQPVSPSQLTNPTRLWALVLGIEMTEKNWSTNTPRVDHNMNSCYLNINYKY